MDRETTAQPHAPWQPIAGRFEGGCFCGRGRYAFDGVLDAGYCHCSICRRTSGAPVMGYASTARAGFTFTRGAPRAVATTAEFERAFCGDCGTLMVSRSLDPARWDQVSVHLGTIDRAATITPRVHICHADRLPWLRIDDALLRVDDSRPPSP